MTRHKWNLVLGLGLLFVVAAACNLSASTANISSVQLGKNKSAAPETTSFGTGDTVYCIATVSNAPGKVSVKGQLVVEAVQGEKSGPVPGLETTVELDGSGTATFTFSPPASGWPEGKYKVDVTLNEDGQQREQKEAKFTVS